MWKVLNNLCKDIDEDQNHSLQLMCKNNELTFAPKMAKGLSEEFYTVPASDMRYIQEQIVECTGCDKEGKGNQRVQNKKELFEGWNNARREK